MALDEAIFEAVRTGAAPPTLRLYAWQPPALSLGYSQSIQDVDQRALARAGWDLVRRPTGGRAILHTDELTYALIAPHDHSLVRGGVLASYQRLSRGLVRGLERLGLEVEVAGETVPEPRQAEDPVCFVVPSAYELTAEGKKLVGSAQVRRSGAVLQHGTLPLYGDLGRICRILRYRTADERERAAERVRQRAVSVEQALGRRLEWQEAARALAEGFRVEFGLELEEGPLSQAELDHAEELTQSRRADASWTTRV